MQCIIVTIQNRGIIFGSIAYIISLLYDNLLWKFGNFLPVEAAWLGNKRKEICTTTNSMLEYPQPGWVPKSWKLGFIFRWGWKKKSLALWKFYMCYPQLSLNKGDWMRTQPSGYILHAGNLFSPPTSFQGSYCSFYFIFFKLRKDVMF